MFVPICGPVVANTVYSENELVGKDVGVTLPEVTPQTADLEALGTFSVPMWNRLEDMETAITKIGADLGMKKMLSGNKVSMEIRFVQTVTQADATIKNIGCKAFLTLIPKSIPGVELAVGEATENEMTYSTLRYQLYVDGEEMWCVDRLAGICRINGVDYAADIQKYL